MSTYVPPDWELVWVTDSMSLSKLSTQRSGSHRAWWGKPGGLPGGGGTEAKARRKASSNQVGKLRPSGRKGASGLNTRPPVTSAGEPRRVSEQGGMEMGTRATQQPRQSLKHLLSTTCMLAGRDDCVPIAPRGGRAGEELTHPGSPPPSQCLSGDVETQHPGSTYSSSSSAAPWPRGSRLQYTAWASRSGLL